MTRALLPRRAPLMDRLWESDETFRAAWRAITVCWGLATLMDSALRILVAYTLPVAAVPAVDIVITIVTVIVLQVPTHLLLRRSGHWHALFARARQAPGGNPPLSVPATLARNRAREESSRERRSQRCDDVHVEGLRDPDGWGWSESRQIPRSSVV